MPAGIASIAIMTISQKDLGMAAAKLGDGDHVLRSVVVARPIVFNLEHGLIEGRPTSRVKLRSEAIWRTLRGRIGSSSGEMIRRSSR